MIKFAWEDNDDAESDDDVYSSTLDCFFLGKGIFLLKVRFFLFHIVWVEEIRQFEMNLMDLRDRGPQVAFTQNYFLNFLTQFENFLKSENYKNKTKDHWTQSTWKSFQFSCEQIAKLQSENEIEILWNFNDHSCLLPFVHLELMIKN